MPGGLFAEQRRGWLARLGREVDAPLDGHGVELSGGHVYHVVLSVPQQDGALGDNVWRELVDEAVARMGFGADDEGQGGCRWVAVHHGPSVAGNDHVHLVVNLVRGDGRVADTYRDWPRWRQWCLDVERRLSLTATSPANKTAQLRPTRAEIEKAKRLRRPVSSRDYLRDVVRVAASRASSAAEFLTLVRQAPVRIEPRWGDDGQLVGYKASVLGDHSGSAPDGQVWFSGSRLARDLSAPKLVTRWASAHAPWPPIPPTERERSRVGQAERRAAIEDVTASVTQARTAVTAAGGDGIGDGVAHSTLDVLVVAAKVFEGYEPGPITAAARAFEQAAATPHVVQPTQWAPVAAELRTAARRLARTGAWHRSGRNNVAVATLLVALAALVAEIAAWRELRGHRQQAIAARHTIHLLNADPAVKDQKPLAPVGIRDLPQHSGAVHGLPARRHDRPMPPRSKGFGQASDPIQRRGR